MQESALTQNSPPGRIVVQRGYGRPGALVVLADFNTQRALPRRWEHYGFRQVFGDPIREAQTFNACCSKNDGI